MPMEKTLNSTISVSLKVKSFNVARIKIIYRKLGKEKAYGMASSDGIIEIDSRLKGKKHLEILLHELGHLLNPKDSEETVMRDYSLYLTAKY